MPKENLSQSVQISTLFSYDTTFSSDSVEWCPFEPYQNLFVCANYQIEDNEGDFNQCKRFGRILLFSISHSTGLELVQIINTAAVLDQKWCPNLIDNTPILGVVNGLKRLEIYKLIDRKLEFVVSHEIVDDDSETLLLSLDWSTGKLESQEPKIVCSDSKGNIHLLHYAKNNLILEQTWHGHSFQAWIAGFYYWDPHIIFTGGDDSLLLKFDTRVGVQPVAKNRTHAAGVTCLHSNKNREFLLATGSYDESVRLWDVRHMKNPSNSIKMPGTLWRLKWDPFRQDLLLCACMLGGVHVIDGRNVDSLEIVGSFLEHKDISYGADWCYLGNKAIEEFERNGHFILGTCSFYDHLLCVSTFNCDIYCH